MLYRFYIYKNTVLAASEFLFCLFNGFSSTSLFLPFHYMIYCVFLTTLPPVYGILSARWDGCCTLSKSTVTPLQFKKIRDNHEKHLRLRSVTLISTAIAQGMLITLIILESYTAFKFEGQIFDASLTDIATVVFSTQLLLVYLKLITAINSESFGRFYGLTILIFTLYVGMLILLSTGLGPLSLRYIDETGLLNQKAFLTIGPIAIGFIIPDQTYATFLKNRLSYKKYHSHFKELEEEYQTVVALKNKLKKDLLLQKRERSFSQVSRLTEEGEEVKISVDRQEEDRVNETVNETMN